METSSAMQTANSTQTLHKAYVIYTHRQINFTPSPTTRDGNAIVEVTPRMRWPTYRPMKWRYLQINHWGGVTSISTFYWRWRYLYIDIQRLPLYIYKKRENEMHEVYCEALPFFVRARVFVKRRTKEIKRGSKGRWEGKRKGSVAVRCAHTRPNQICH